MMIHWGEAGEQEKISRVSRKGEFIVETSSIT